MEPLHPAISRRPRLTSQILRWFECWHLPPQLQEVVAPFAELARQVAHRSPNNPETTVALRKLLEAKDAAVRAAIAKD